MRVLITGSAGMLGRQVAKEYTRRGAEVFPLSRNDLDITEFEAVNNTLALLRPHLVVNCAAYTNVDAAETERERAFTVNGVAPRLVSLACRLHGAALVHISTDYIFDGQLNRPYLVSDLPNPVNTYGASKLMGEQGIRESGCLYYIVRTSWLFGPEGRNFAETVLKLANEKKKLRVVSDQCGTPTYTPDLAKGIADLADTGICGTYHLTNSGVTTWYGFAQKIIQTAGLDAEVEPCSTEDFPRPARRPANSALNPLPIQKVLGYTPQAWEKAVEHYINNRPME